MYGIEQMKAQGILFSIIKEKEASRIMQTEYTPDQLLLYAALFPCYQTTEKKGKAIHVEFAYLYDLAGLDRCLQKIMSALCMDVEQTLRTVFMADCFRVNAADNLVETYVAANADDLFSAYSPEQNDFLAKHPVALSKLSLYSFLNVLQFGSLQRFLRFFYDKYAHVLYHAPYAPFESSLESIRRVRNASVHGNGLLWRISEPADSSFQKNLSLLSWLGRQGIGQKTRQTNMSKPIVHDLTCLLYQSVSLLPRTQCEDFFSAFNDFLMEQCTAHASYYAQSPMLLSAYRFACRLLTVLTANNFSTEKDS